MDWLGDMSGWTFLAGGAAVGLLASCWRQVKGFLWWVASCLVVRQVLYGELAMAAVRHLRTKGRHLPPGRRIYYALYRYLPSEEKSRLLLTEFMHGSARLYWLGWRPILCSPGSIGTHSNGTTDHDAWPPTCDWSHYKITLVYLRGCFDYDTLARSFVQTGQGVRDHGDNKQQRCTFETVPERVEIRAGSSNKGEAAMPVQDETMQTIYRAAERTIDYTLDQLERQREPDLLDLMSYPDEILEGIEEAKRWHASRHWYKERRIPWKLGWLLTGKPGTGKTSLVRGLAWMLDMPVVSFDLASLDNSDLVHHWKNRAVRAPIIYLLEDLDGVFNGRKNVLGGGGESVDRHGQLFAPRAPLTFDCLLNVIGGLAENDGIFTVITTNHPEKLDPAIAVVGSGNIPSRPGRVDRILQMPSELPKSGRLKIARRIMAGCADDRIGVTVEAGKDDTGAQFQYRCQREALTAFWLRPPAEAV